VEKHIGNLAYTLQNFKVNLQRNCNIFYPCPLGFEKNKLIWVIKGLPDSRFQIKTCRDRFGSTDEWIRGGTILATYSQELLAGALIS
jgi:hypothetical protein